MSKHTPGPWSVVDQGERVMVECGDEHADWICEVTGGFRATNAQLIAAAPDLLEALIELTMATLTIPDIPPGPMAGIWDKAEAAIAKATGED